MNDPVYGQVTLENPPSSMQDDETVVVFRGTDPNLLPLLDFYIAIASGDRGEAIGAIRRLNDHVDSPDIGGSPPSFVSKVLNTRARVEEYQTTHATKIPD